MFFKKKKDIANPQSCLCEKKSPTLVQSTCCPEAEEGICCVKVLGMGCKSCHQQYAFAKEAVTRMGLSLEVEYITDPEQVMSYGAMSMPALVVNNKVVSVGKVLSPVHMEALLRKFTP